MDRVEPFSKLVVDNLTEVVASTVAGYPLNLARTLMQLGYEPVSPVKGRYPSVVGYLRFIKNDRGFTAMYTGLSYHLSYVFAQRITYKSLDLLTRPEKQRPSRGESDGDNDDNDSGDLHDFIYECMRESCLKIQTTLITYPIFTIGIGYVTAYFFDLKEPIVMTYKDLYSGVIPKLLFEVVTLWAAKISWRLTVKYLGDRTPVEQQIISRLPPLVVSSILYPFNVVTTVMADGGRSRRNPKFNNWQQCYHYLKYCRGLRRGSSLIWRYSENIGWSPLIQI